MTYLSPAHRSGVFLGRLGIFSAPSPCQLCGSTGKVRAYQLRERTLTLGSFQAHRLDLCRGCRGGVEGYAEESQGLYTLRKGRQDSVRRVVPASLRSFLLLPHGVMRWGWTRARKDMEFAVLDIRKGLTALKIGGWVALKMIGAKVWPAIDRVGAWWLEKYRAPSRDPSRSAYISAPLGDIGRPQKEFVRLEQSGGIRGRVLDVGCGTGENALYLAGLGYPMLGVDAVPAAIEQARGKARTRSARVEFQEWDALELPGLERRFDTVIDSGLYHVLSNSERKRFAHSLAAALRPEGTYQMLCFSEHEPGSGGPRRVTQAEIRTTFGEGWKVESIRKAKFETQLPTGDAQAWLSSITRLHTRNFQKRIIPASPYLGTSGKKSWSRRLPS